jgi:predicted DCC family thiol-disulfide oxidoreductase YuxK
MSNQPYLIYDADCGFCTQTAKRLKKWTNQQVDIVGWQFVPEQMAMLGLTAEDGLTQVWYVDANGRLFGGAEAVNRSLRYCWWLRPISYLYFVPGIRQLQNWGYRWVARNRYKFPGSTDACRIKSD